jgi:tetratricopeptide (TPR) repeat protein
VAALILSAVVLLVAATVPPAPPRNPAGVVADARRLIRQQRYNDAINLLEQYLETSPDDGEALTYFGAAHLYAERDFVKAQEMFERAFRAGGGASFVVNHSHESMMSGDDMTVYCRGWLDLRHDRLDFVPEEGDHGFSLAYGEVAELKQNRVKAFFHLKRGGANQNFRPRTGDERETLLILSLYKKFSR